MGTPKRLKLLLGGKIAAQQEPQQQRRRRTFRERRDVLKEYNDQQLIETFRLDRAGILYLTDLVRDV